ncbi:MAG: GNAT family N-acetyltransferase [Pseudomonadota bacterium]
MKGLAGAAIPAHHLLMSTETIAIRTAKPSDAPGIAAVHDAAWRFAYRGVLPGAELERMISRRGEAWWLAAIGRQVPMIVLEAGEMVRGYLTYGASRMRNLPYKAEVYELYIQPEYTGLGLGRKMFRTVQDRLSRRGHDRLLVWCLEDNAEGCAFYEHLGGRAVASAKEPFETVEVAKIAYAFDRRERRKVRLPR